MPIITKRQALLLAALFVYSFVPTVGGLFRIVELANGPSIMPPNPRAIADPMPIVLHVIGSFVFCIFGAVQFLPNLRRALPRVHQINGYAVAVAGILSAATGLWMTQAFVFPEALQGALLYWARVFLSVAMMGLIVSAISSAKCGEVFHHQANMMRAYAIGQGASTQAFLGMATLVLTGIEPTGPLRDGMMVLAWAINLYVAEFLIHRTKRHPMGQKVAQTTRSRRISSKSTSSRSVSET